MNKEKGTNTRFKDEIDQSVAKDLNTQILHDLTFLLFHQPNAICYTRMQANGSTHYEHEFAYQKELD